MIDVVVAVVVAAVAVVFDRCFCCIAPITTVVKRVFCSFKFYSLVLVLKPFASFCPAIAVHLSSFPPISTTGAR